MQHVEGDFAEVRHVVRQNLYATSETIGRRDAQEDAHAVDISDRSRKLSRLTADERHAHMALHFLLMQVAAAENQAFNAKGCCACAVTGWYRGDQVHVSTSYVGDSVAILIGLDKTSKLKYAVACNPDLHNIDNAEEILLVKNGQGRRANPYALVNKRLAWELLVTRSIGDADYEEFGVCHAPVTTLVEKEYTSLDQVYMVVACDGAMEHVTNKHQTANDFANELGTLFVDALASGKKTAKFLADMIRDNAFNAGSGDNISVMVMQINKKALPITAAVFDGHDGVEVSQLCRDNFAIHMQVVNDLYKHLQSKLNAERRIAEFNTIIQAILNFDNQHNYLHELQALIKEIKTHVFKSPELTQPISWLERVRDYYLRQLKVLRVVSEDYVLEHEVVKIVPIKLDVYELTEFERKQKEAMSELYLYLNQCDLKHCKTLTLVRNKLCDSFGKPGEAIHGITHICENYFNNSRKFKIKIKFPFSKQVSMEENAMVVINELMTILNQPDKPHRNLVDVKQELGLALGVTMKELVMQPVARPHE